MTQRLRSTSNAILIVYTGLTLACAPAYGLGGMSTYDALAHAFTTLAAGGFSPNPLSFQDFASPTLEWLAIIFMTFAGANFALLYQGFVGRPEALFRDAEFKAYLTISVIAALIIAASLTTFHQGENALRTGFFQALSIVTTTGYASVNFAECLGKPKPYSSC